MQVQVQRGIAILKRSLYYSHMCALYANVFYSPIVLQRLWHINIIEWEGSIRGVAGESIYSHILPYALRVKFARKPFQNRLQSFARRRTIQFKSVNIGASDGNCEREESKVSRNDSE